jgi:hypothetical protein
MDDCWKINLAPKPYFGDRKMSLFVEADDCCGIVIRRLRWPDNCTFNRDGQRGFNFWARRGAMQDLERNEKHIVMLELLAASSIFFIAAIVLYVVFQYRPL